MPITRDQPPAYVPFEKSHEWLSESTRGVRLDESWAVIQGPNTPNPGEEVGADLVQTLPGDVSSYYVAIDYNTGKAALFQYRQPQVAMARTMDRDRGYYRTLARQANVQRELSGALLKDINRRNREAWSKHRG